MEELVDESIIDYTPQDSAEDDDDEEVLLLNALAPVQPVVIDDVDLDDVELSFKPQAASSAPRVSAIPRVRYSAEELLGFRHFDHCQIAPVIGVPHVAVGYKRPPREPVANSAASSKPKGTITYVPPSTAGRTVSAPPVASSGGGGGGGGGGARSGGGGKDWSSVRQAQQQKAQEAAAWDASPARSGRGRGGRRDDDNESDAVKQGFKQRFGEFRSFFSDEGAFVSQPESPASSAAASQHPRQEVSLGGSSLHDLFGAPEADLPAPPDQPTAAAAGGAPVGGSRLLGLLNAAPESQKPPQPVGDIGTATTAATAAPQQSATSAGGSRLLGMLNASRQQPASSAAAAAAPSAASAAVHVAPPTTASSGSVDLSQLFGGAHPPASVPAVPAGALTEEQLLSGARRSAAPRSGGASSAGASSAGGSRLLGMLASTSGGGGAGASTPPGLSENNRRIDVAELFKSAAQQQHQLVSQQQQHQQQGSGLGQWFPGLQPAVVASAAVPRGRMMTLDELEGK